MSLGRNDEIRAALATMPTDHDAAGEYRPTVEQIFTPEQHANALDPNTPVVVGSRGTGKSFWAGVLEQEATRNVASIAYPNIGLSGLVVRAGYTGFASEGAVTPKVIDARVPKGMERDSGTDLWQAVIIRAARSVLDESALIEPIKEVIQSLSDPEEAVMELRRLDREIAAAQKTLLVTFDAIDTWSHDWQRS
ncbi:MAG TPA: hypothetical protein VFG49_08165, partial [Dyella sp.]|uniref:hypothetical protein n=1 Tax=Dyella sp. TaxID=1869338 RepID=UPI002D770983